MPSTSRKNQVRLKLYIPESKFREWSEYLEEYNPISDFFFNFSLFVRKTLLNIPVEEAIPIFTHQKYPINSSKSKKIEKTVWVSKTQKLALIQNKGILSLNSFILLILDLNIFGKTTEKQNIFYVLQLRERIEKLEKRVYNLIDQLNVKIGN
ncbi:MAG: hypothetical protein ACTSWX_10575 [Promethearchaeota archaeon]